MNIAFEGPLCQIYLNIHLRESLLSYFMLHKIAMHIEQHLNGRKH